jgi:hypothetical protein
VCEAETLDTAQARMFLGLRGVAVSQESLQNWCRDGKLPGAVQLPSRQWRIPVAALEAVVSAQAEAQ